MRRGRAAIAAGAIAAIVVGGVVVAKRRGGEPTKPAVDAAAIASAPDALVVPRLPPDAAEKPNHFVGSARCGDCHEKELAAWKKSWHARALGPGDKASVVGDYEDRHFAGTSSEAWMKHAGTGFAMRAHGPDGALADYTVDWVIGGKRMQDAVTVFPDGRWQVLPIYYHVTGKSWVDYTEAKQGALAPEHPFYWTNARRMANHECLDCHVTALHVDFDAPTQHWDTTFVDGNVACESCHGAGAVHAESQDKRDVVHPAHAVEAGMSACARCHGPRQPLFPLLDAEHQFKLGQSYDELYDPIVVTLGTGMSPEFFPDGRPKTSSFEYQALLQSACYRRGKATCLSCHAAPHAAKGHAELREADVDAPCRGCHQSLEVGHSHHKTATCVACHMPSVVSGVLDHFADHAIDLPNPSTTAKHGVPNACATCHADRSTEQLATDIAGWWPKAQAREARRSRLADAFDDAPASIRASGPALAATIADDGEAPTLRGAAMIVLGRRFGPKSAQVIEPYLASTDVILRAKACEALAAAHATGAADAIAARLPDGSLRVRQAAALALVDLHDGRAEAALRALTGDPASEHLMVPHLELGNLLAHRRDFAAARDEFTRVVTLAPYFVDPLVELAGVSAELGDFAAARSRLTQALALEPHHAGALGLRAQIDRTHPLPHP